MTWLKSDDPFYQKYWGIFYNEYAPDKKLICSFVKDTLFDELFSQKRYYKDLIRRFNDEIQQYNR